MDHRLDDLRGWWDRTRRRPLRPGVRSVVERVRPVTSAPVIRSSDPPVPGDHQPVTVLEAVEPATVQDGAGVAPAVAEAVVDVPPDAAAAPDEREGSDQSLPPIVPAAAWDSTRAPGSWPELDEALDDQPDATTEGAEPGTEREMLTGHPGDLGVRIASGEQVPDADGGAAPALPAAAGTSTPQAGAVAIGPTGLDEVEGRPLPADRDAESIAGEAADRPIETVSVTSEVVAPSDIAGAGWAAPGNAPWETPMPAGSAEGEDVEPGSAPAPEATRPDVTAPEPERGSVAVPEPAPASVFTAAPESAAEAGSQAIDEWAGIRWSAADQPAPWSAAPAAAGEDALGLDDDQRRWLGRDVKSVEGIGSGYGGQLEAVGISTLRDLLLRGARRRGRQEIADATGISGRLILRWVNNADLFRIRGVGTQYADLLEAAGVDTVVELALRRADNLTARLATTNEIRSRVRQVPSEVQVADWVRQARELPRIVAY